MNTPPKIGKSAEEASTNLLPTKSKEAYFSEFSKFSTWCNFNEIHNISENVLLVYFQELASTKKSSTLWTVYSMLKSTLNINKNIDISRFARLQALLKRHSDGYQPKKSLILDFDQINKFLETADDTIFLAIKVVLIIGFNGACRREEITNILTDNIEFKTDQIIITIPKTKTNVPRVFVITKERWIGLINKYRILRPYDITHNRFFLTYRNGRCIRSPIGINTIGKMPQIIAKFLKLENPQNYTGHCFRRSSVTHLANQGGDLITIKRHGGWRSSAVAEGYIETSMSKRIEVSQLLNTEQVTVTGTNTSVINRSLTSNSAPNITINAHDSSTVTVNYHSHSV